jgi:hypothetical protein
MRRALPGWRRGKFMRNSQKILVVAGIVAAAVLTGGVIGWLGGHGWGGNPTPAASVSKPVLPATNLPVASIMPPVPITPATNRILKVVKPVTANDDWTNAVQAIVDSDMDDAEQAKRLFALFPKLPEAGQVAVADELTFLVEDTNYAPLGELLKDPKLPVAVQDVLMDDAQARPDSMLLPLMLDVARNPDHPKAADAKDVLETYLEKDYGSDWAKWQKHMEAWLKDNPD